MTVSKTGIRQNVIQKDYYLSLDMAKELAMVERNEKGNVIDLTTALADPAKLRTALLAYTENVLTDYKYFQPTVYIGVDGS